MIFLTKPCKELTELEIQQCSNLFSNHYGFWGKEDNRGREGKRVTLGPGYYKEFKDKLDHYVAFAYDSDILVGHAFYIREDIESVGKFSWVLQIVVHTDYRQKKIGKKLLYSIWGFSGDSAWGLATANPYTVRTLEAATFRSVDSLVVLRNIDKIKQLGKHITFVKDYKVNREHTLVNTEFYIDQSNVEQDILSYGKGWDLGGLIPGHEWLAFTFQDQDLREISSEEFNDIVSFSEQAVKDAYGRMRFPSQPWAKHAAPEVEFIISNLNLNGSESIGDFGCGIGRHSIEFAKRGFKVHGIDFSIPNIQRAKEETWIVNTKSDSFFKVCNFVLKWA